VDYLDKFLKRASHAEEAARLGIACLRSLGLPACYVSGYLRTRPPEGQPRLVGADASHAWFRIFCPGAGWVDFDPTNNLQPGEEHIVVAYGRDFSDVSPVAGILTGGVCQDFAHLMLGLCRSLKIPARYISGYLATESASATHACTEVFVPGHGWRALDPMHNCQINETCVKIGRRRDYGDVPPVSGNYHGTLERTMEVHVRINAVE